jgi:hypothetical protein
VEGDPHGVIQVGVASHHRGPIPVSEVSLGGQGGDGDGPGVPYGGGRAGDGPGADEVVVRVGCFGPDDQVAGHFLNDSLRAGQPVLGVGDVEELDEVGDLGGDVNVEG